MPPIQYSLRKASSPSEALRLLALQLRVDLFSQEFAAKLDAQDPLRDYKKRFALPKRKASTKALKKTEVMEEEAMEEEEAAGDADEESVVYLCGNLLDFKPFTADEVFLKHLEKLGQVDAELTSETPLPEATWEQSIQDTMGRLVGGDPSCVSLLNAHKVNPLLLHLFSFFQPSEERYKILVEDHAFPFDRCALKSQIQRHGLDPSEALVEVSPRPGEYAIRTEDILKMIEEEGPRTAIVCLGGIQPITGQKLDMAAITTAAHAQGCLVGWDLTHVVGAIKLELDNWGADFACWSTFKYLKSSFGAIAGAYTHKRHSESGTGLKGNRVATLWDMTLGVDGFRLWNSPPILVALVMASLEILNEAGMDKLLEKQFLLTGYLEMLLKHYFGDGDPSACVITPGDVTERGCQLSVEFSCALGEVHQDLKNRGVMCDVITPTVVRLVPVPLYNSFRDVFVFTQTLKDVFAKCRNEAEMS
ncbi:kynureninase-like [Oratosquilla oratoria]|uniref:kynureninase-like n=1 Tax=Oratosquilla oratoria TaxID=337810 RepID=UPI003F769803